MRTAGDLILRARNLSGHSSGWTPEQQLALVTSGIRDVMRRTGQSIDVRSDIVINEGNNVYPLPEDCAWNGIMEAYYCASTTAPTTNFGTPLPVYYIQDAMRLGLGASAVAPGQPAHAYVLRNRQNGPAATGGENDSTSPARQQLFLNTNPSSSQEGHRIVLVYLTRAWTMLNVNDPVPVEEEKREAVAYFVASRLSEVSNVARSEWLRGRYAEEVMSNLTTDAMNEASGGYPTQKSRYNRTLRRGPYGTR